MNYLSILLVLLTFNLIDNLSDSKKISPMTGHELVQLADLDGDSDKDIISYSFKNIYFNENTGNGNYSYKSINIGSISSNASLIESAQLTFDNKEDFLVAQSNALFLFKNKGDLKFEKSTLISSNYSNILYVKTIDIDNDDDLDILFANGSNIGLIKNLNNNGNFSDVIVLKDSLKNTSYFYCEDIENDGDIDIIFADNNTQTVSLLENVDQINELYETVHLIDSVDFKYFRYFDLTADGKKDVVISTYSQIYWFEQNSDSLSFGSKNIIEKDHNNFYVTNVLDIDWDGDNDLIGCIGNDLFYCENINNGESFGDDLIYEELPDKDNILIEDLNNDNNLDILANCSSKIIANIKTTGSLNFELDTILMYGCSNIDNFILADLNADSIDDVIYTSNGTNKLFWIPNYGKNNFGDVIPIGDIDATNLEAVDIDGDNDIDIVVSDYSETKVYWFENLDGKGNFGSINPISSDNGNGIYFATGDFNGDNKIDIVITDALSLVGVVFNDGDGNFSTRVELESTYRSGPREVTTFDIDRDGDLDIGVAFFLAGKVVWYENLDGAGNFSSQNKIENISCPSNIKFADIDNDGDGDAIFSVPGFYCIYQQSSSGTFSYKYADGSTYRVNFITTVDLDNDNDLDLLVGYNGSKEALKIYLNEENKYKEEYVISGETYVKFGYVSDLDKDGDLDIIGSHSSQIFYFENGPSPEITYQPFNNIDICDQNDIILNVTGNYIDSYQWMMSDKNSYSPIYDNDFYSGSNTAKLEIIGESDDIFEKHFYCQLTNEYDTISTDTVVVLPDQTAPKITCPSDTVIDLGNQTNKYEINTSDFDPTKLYDNCAILSIENNYNSDTTLQSSIFYEGTNEVIWTISDWNGNISTCSFSIEIKSTLSVNNLNNEDIKIFPNPFSDILQITSTKQNINEIMVLNINGTQVLKIPANDSGKYDFSNIKNGNYIIQIKTNKGLYSGLFNCNR